MYSRGQDKFYGFKSLSKSQEVISAALGGAMKRMTNGAVSDISYALPMAPTVLNDTDNTLDLVLVPGGHVLMSHPDLLRTNSGSLQLLPITESGRSTPGSLCSISTVHDVQYTSQNADMANAGSSNPTVPSENTIEPLFEVSEEEEDSNKSSNEDEDNKNKDSVTTKEQKETQNYEKKKMKLPKSESVAENMVTPKPTISAKQTASIGVQVNLTKSMSSPNLVRKANVVELIHLEDAGNKRIPRTSLVQRETSSAPRSPVRKDSKGGFSHDSMLGEDGKKSYAWRQELAKFQTQKQKLRVSELIGTFDKQGSGSDGSLNKEGTNEIKLIKKRRRGSLQIQLESSVLKDLAKTGEEAEILRVREEQEKAEKALRRRSTSSILMKNLENKKFSDILSYGSNKGTTDEKAIEKSDKSEEDTTKDQSKAVPEPQETTTTPANDDTEITRKKTWDYFEIDHPKAISEKKLQQLKAKYQRRKTDGSIYDNKKNVIKEEEAEEEDVVDKSKSVVSRKIQLLQQRSKSIPGGQLVPTTTSATESVNLDLSIDPLTGECLASRTETAILPAAVAEPTQPSLESQTKQVKLRRTSADDDSTSSSRRSSRSSRRRSSHLADIQEQCIPEEKILEVRIDPLTGSVETIEVSRLAKSRAKNLTVDVKSGRQLPQDDDGIGSLPNTPTDLFDKPPKLALATTGSIDDMGVFTSSEEVLPTSDAGHRVHPPLPPGQTKTMSLDGDDGMSLLSWEESGDDCRPASAQANVNVSTSSGNISTSSSSNSPAVNSINRMCTGAFTRAMERYNSTITASAIKPSTGEPQEDSEQRPSSS